MTDEPGLPQPASPVPGTPSEVAGPVPSEADNPTPETSPTTVAPQPRQPDPWAHRRAEPRTFAFIWTMYLFIATVSTYAITVTSGVGGYDVIRPAARTLLVLIAAGLVIAWPLVRFTQEPDRRPIAGPLLDMIVVLIPIQAIIWPQSAWWLTGWPVSVVAAVAAFTAAWTCIVAALLSVSHSLRPAFAFSPSMCMGLSLGLLAGAHVPMAIAAAIASRGAEQYIASQFHPTWLISPIAGVYELTQERTWSGVAAMVSPGHWRMILMLWGVSVALWLVAVAVHARTRRGNG